MKKFFAAILIATLLCGCFNTRSGSDTYYKDDQTEVTAAPFNDEVYIWEKFLFPTNKTDNLKRK